MPKPRDHKARQIEHIAKRGVRSMETLLRFLTLTLRENQTELQRSEILRDQLYLIANMIHLV
jgi:hypothetical protein